MNATAAKTTVRPFWGRVSVVPSPVEEEQLGSGLIVPHKYEGADDVERGVVAHIDDDWENPDRRASLERIQPGTVVWYRKGTKVAGVVLLELDDILAYEAT